jgi:hypothetical protein
LRPLVIMRKISGGSRSADGSLTRLTLFSLVSTWAARGFSERIWKVPSSRNTNGA